MRAERGCGTDREGVVENGDNALLDTQRLVAQPILVQHVVRLVEHEHLHLRHIYDLPPQEVRHRPWCAYDNVRVDASRALRDAVLDCVFSLYRSELAHRDNDRHDLPRQFTRRC